MQKISSLRIAQDIVDRLKTKPLSKKFLAVFLIEEDLASKSFVLQKEKIAKEIGIDFRIYQIEKNITNDVFRKKISQVANAKNCGGVIVQLPLPEHINQSYVCNAIPPSKDVDLLSEKMIGSFYNNRSKIIPPSVGVVECVLKSIGVDLSSIKKAAVVGQGRLVGKPITNWLLAKVPHLVALDKGSDLKSLEDADLVVLGTGQAGLIKASMLKKGSGVIDFGYGKDETGKLRGDFDENSLSEVISDYLSFYTPTPGGTGPILVANLFKNFFDLNEE